MSVHTFPDSHGPPFGKSSTPAVPVFSCRSRARRVLIGRPWVQAVVQPLATGTDSDRWAA